MIDFARLLAQLPDFAAYRQGEAQAHAARLARATAALTACARDWEGLAARAEALPRGPLRGIPLGPPGAAEAAPARPPTVTVVATDGSQIFPDRHVEPACYLLNVGRVALHYGTAEPPLIAAEPAIRYRQADLADLAPDDEPSAADFTAEVVSALRDELELDWLHRTALGARRSGRALVALADGTLIRWMLRGMKNRRLEDRLLARYLEILSRFQADGLPLASYVSRPGSAEVVGLLRLFLGEDDEAPGPDTLRGLHDRHLFEAVLAPGERSALFASRSHVLAHYGEAHRVLAFYLHTGDEVGRVEVPRWVAEAGFVPLVHAVVLDQARKGGGYPIALQEAHQRAVVRAEEKEIFYRLLARCLRERGHPVPTYSGKAASKRAPRV
ncbi:MAG: DNA double-strand break repair nuclease NurA [Rubricoccaceae bacterium]